MQTGVYGEDQRAQYQTTGKRMAPQHSRSTRMKISFQVMYDWLPSSLSSTITSATRSRICHRQRTQSQSSITGYLPCSPPLSPPPHSPESVTNRGHSLSEASLVTVVTLFHYHHHHTVQNLSQRTVSVKHHWLPSSLSSTITSTMQSRICH